MVHCLIPLSYVLTVCDKIELYEVNGSSRVKIKISLQSHQSALTDFDKIKPFQLKGVHIFNGCIP